MGALDLEKRLEGLYRRALNSNCFHVRLVCLRPTTAAQVSGYLQGRLLVALTKLCGAARVLEVGTFTGYSALCFAEGGAHVTTLEIDPVAASMAARYFARSGALGAGIDLRLGLPALAQLAAMRPEVPYDLVFLDADKRKVGGSAMVALCLFFSAAF